MMSRMSRTGRVFDHVTRVQPSATRRADTVAHLLAEPLRAVCVTVNAHQGACGDSAARDRAIHVEVNGRAVDFENRAGLDRGREQRVEIQLVGRAIADDAIGRMRDDVDQRMTHGRDVPCRQLVAGLTRRVVERRHDEVETAERCVVQVEAAIRQNVDLHAVEHGDARDPSSDSLDFLRLLHQPSGVDRARGSGAGRMIRDGDVLVPEATRSQHHVLDAIATVAPVGVQMQIAPHIVDRNEIRQRARPGRLNLARPLSQLGRDEWQIECRVDIHVGGVTRRRRLPGARQP